MAGTGNTTTDPALPLPSGWGRCAVESIKKRANRLPASVAAMVRQLSIRQLVTNARWKQAPDTSMLAPAHRAFRHCAPHLAPRVLISEGVNSPRAPYISNRPRISTDGS
jgi:hypothetical protein